MKVCLNNIKPRAEFFTFKNDFLKFEALDKNAISREDFIDKKSRDFDDSAFFFLLLGLLLGGHKVDLFKKSSIKNAIGYLCFMLSTILMSLELSQKYLLSKIYDYKNKNE